MEEKRKLTTASDMPYTEHGDIMTAGLCGSYTVEGHYSA
jgi:hypothetical protein